MQEINEVSSDIEGTVDLIYLENGLPRLKTLSILDIAMWQPKENQELVGVYQDSHASRLLHYRLERGEALFVAKD